MAIKLSLHKNRPDKGVVLEFHAPDATDAEMAKSEEFKDLVYTTMPKETGWFHQGGCLPDNRPSDWHMFEFWNYTKHSALVIQEAHAIALQLGIPLELGDTLPSTGTHTERLIRSAIQARLGGGTNLTRMSREEARKHLFGSSDER